MWEEVNTGSAGIEKPLDILAIAAHPDDVEQTCGGTLLRMAEIGYRTGVLDLTAGDMGTRGTPETRDEQTEPHRPTKIIYSSLYANVTPSFVVDISSQFERRMDALFCYESQYGDAPDAAHLFPQQQEIRERLSV